MYIIHNLTTRTIILADLRVEIGPRKILDLTRVATRSAIEGSRDLKKALAERKLALTRHSIIETQETAAREPFVEQQQFDEEQLSKLIRRAVSEELNQQKKEQDSSNIEKSIQQAICTMSGLVSSIRDEINSVKIDHKEPAKKKDDFTIDPERLASLSQQSIAKINEDIETGGQRKGKEIRIVNKQSAADLANEL